jgi:hypothetical protein
MEHRWNETDGQTELLAVKPAPAPLCANKPQVDRLNFTPR